MTLHLVPGADAKGLELRPSVQSSRVLVQCSNFSTNSSIVEWESEGTPQDPKLYCCPLSASGGRASGCGAASVCQQAGHAQRNAGERADGQTGAPALTQPHGEGPATPREPQMGSRSEGPPHPFFLASDVSFLLPTVVCSGHLCHPGHRPI